MHIIHLREHNTETGLLRIRPSVFTRAIRVRPSVISILPSYNRERARVARFIEAAYGKAYGACIRVDYPNLISVRDREGRLVAAAGFRFADQSPLFLEQYTDRPMDEILGVGRRGIAEVGNLATDGGGVSIFLFMALASYLDTARISHAVITSTRNLERRLNHLGLESRRVCPASHDRVTRVDGDWGRYYDTRPFVLAGRVDRALKRLREIFGDGFYARRPRLYPRLHFNPEQA